MDNYSNDDKAALATVIATSANVPVPAVAVTITAASVVIKAVIDTAAASVGTSLIFQRLSAAFSDAAAATALLSGAAPGLVVESAPVLQISSATGGGSPPPLPTPTQLEQGAAEPRIGQRISRYSLPIIFGAALLVMIVFAIASRGTDVASMPWGAPWDDAGRTVLFATLASSNFDFFGDLLYFVVKAADGGYWHIGLVAASIAAFVVPAIACALRNGFFSQFVATGRTIAPVLKRTIVREHLRSWRSLPRFLLWLLALLLLLGLVPLLLLLWTLALLGTLVLGVNMKLFALPGFLRFYRRLLFLSRSLQPRFGSTDLDQIVALNEALFFELALESVPQICIVIVNESLTPDPWSPLAIAALGGSIFFVACLLWKFGDRICRKGFREGLRVPVLACNQDQRDAIKRFMARSANPQAVHEVDVKVDIPEPLSSSSRARVDPTGGSQGGTGRAVESTQGISLPVCSPSGVTCSGSNILISSSQPTSTLRPAPSSSAPGSLATTAQHSSSASGRSDFTTVHTADITSAAVRAVADAAPLAQAARQKAVLRAGTNNPLVTVVASVSASDIRFDSPRLRLGAGAFGTVYRSAEEGWQGSTVAVKELKVDVSEGTRASTLEALRREAVTLASLRHQNVVSFLGVCLDASQPMLVTEYVAGGALKDALYPRGGGSSALSYVDRLRIAKDIAAGLLHIHSQSIVHRDLKPANVLLAKIDGSLIAKVADVGLARALHGTCQHMSANTGGGAGTPQYMSPEQWTDQVQSSPPCCHVMGSRMTSFCDACLRAHVCVCVQELTTASDVYAYGVLLNETLTSVRPWPQVAAWAIMGKVTNGERPDLVTDGEVGELVERCWQASRDSRPSMPEVFDAMMRMHNLQVDAARELPARV